MTESSKARFDWQTIASAVAEVGAALVNNPTLQRSFSDMVANGEFQRVPKLVIALAENPNALRQFLWLCTSATVQSIQEYRKRSAAVLGPNTPPAEQPALTSIEGVEEVIERVASHASQQETTADTTADTTAATPSFAKEIDVLFRDSVYRKPQTFRPLATLHTELAHTLCELGLNLRAAGRPEQARRRLSEAVHSYREAIRELPGVAELYVYLGQTCELLVRQDDALRAYVEAVVLAPEHAQIIFRQAHQILTPDLAASLGDLQKSFFATAAIAGAEGENRAMIFNFWGRVSLYRKDYPQAIHYFEEALTTNPHSMYIREGLGDALWHAGQADSGIAHLKIAVDEADARGDTKRRTATRLKLAGVLVEQNRHAEAQQAIEVALTLDPAYAPALEVLLGRCHLVNQRADLALAAADRTLATTLEIDVALQVEALTLRATALLALKDYTAADQAAEAALNLNPTHSEAILDRAQALILTALAPTEAHPPDKDSDKDNLLDKGIRLLQVYQQQSVPTLANQQLLITALQRAGRPQREISEALRRALSLAPPDEAVSIQWQLASAYVDEQRPQEALVALDEVARHDPNAQTAAWWQLYGDAQVQASLREDALTAYRQGLAHDGNNLALRRRLAGLLLDLGDPAAALQEWQIIAEAEPGDGASHLQVAICLHSLNRLDAARQSVDQAIAAGLDDEEAMRAAKLKCQILEATGAPGAELALAYVEAGKLLYWTARYDQAVEWFQHAQAADPDLEATYWFWADALHMLSYRPAPDYVDGAVLEDSLNQWEKGIARGIPGADFAWAYLTRAYIAERRANLPSTDPTPCYWEAIAFAEQTVLLQSWNSYAWLALGRFHRLLAIEVNALQASNHAYELSPNDNRVLEERAAVLADAGEFDASLTVIQQLEITSPSDWLTSVKAYVLVHLQRPAEAVEALTLILQSAPADVWSRNQRATSYRMLGQIDAARNDYAQIVSTLDTPENTHVENAFLYAISTYYLSILANPTGIDTEMLANAISCFTPLCDYGPYAASAYNFRGLCYLAQGNLTMAGADIEHGIALINSVRELDDFGNDDVAFLSGRLTGWPHATEVRTFLDQVQEQVAARRTEIAVRPTATQELERIIADLSEAGEEHSWASTAAHAGLARLYCEEARWHEAIDIYRQLSQANKRLPQLETGITIALTAAQAAGDNHLRSGQPQAALTTYTDALKASPDPVSPGEPWRADFQARIGYACHVLGDADGARRYFTQALEQFRASGKASPGVELGRICRYLLTDATQYWALVSTWQAMQDQAPEATWQSELTAAGQALVPFLAEHFQLSAQSGESPQLIPVVSPIVIEMDNRAVPEDTSPESPLFKSYIPQMRARLLEECGVTVPGIRVRGNESDMPPYSYLFMLDEVPILIGTLEMGWGYCPVESATLEALGIPAHGYKQDMQALTGGIGSWVIPEYWETVRNNGLPLWEDPLQYMIAHMEALLRQNLADFVGYQEVENLLERWRAEPTLAAMIEASLPTLDLRLRFARLLRALVREQVPIVRAQTILETVQAAGLDNDDVVDLVCAVRLRLKDQLPGNNSTVTRVTLPQHVEAELGRWLWRQDGKAFFAMSPEATQAVLGEIRQLVNAVVDGKPALVVEETHLRPFVRRLVELEFPHLVVMAKDELLPQTLDQPSPVGASREE